MNERIQKMAKQDGSGFDELFNQECNKHRTKRMAFYALNYEYKKVMGEKRYKNYDSYRMSRTKRIKKETPD